MPTKGKSLVYAIISFAVFAYTIQTNSCFVYLYPLAAILTVVYTLNFLVKFARDRKFEQRARRERYSEPEAFDAYTEKTTHGSGWIGLDAWPLEGE